MLSLFLEILWWSLTNAIAVLWIPLLVICKRRNLNEKLCELSFVEFLKSPSSISGVSSWICSCTSRRRACLWRFKSVHDERKLIVKSQRGV